MTSAQPEVITDGAVRIVDQLITHVGSFADLVIRFPADLVQGGPESLITPGFVNTHGHFSEGLITGLAEQYSLMDWLHELIIPVAPHLDEELAYLGTMLAGIQMLRTGITTTNDMFVCDPPPGGRPVTPGVVRALDELGLRGLVSFGAGDAGPGMTVAGLLAEHDALAEAAAASRMCRFRVGIRTVAAQSPELLAASVRLAIGGGYGVHIHLHEVEAEVAGLRRIHGVSPIEHCARQGLFGAPTLAAHCVWVSREDQAILAGHGVGVAHNPVSNMILASGVCPVGELREQGVAVGLGVDGPASNDRQDMLETLKTTVLLQRAHYRSTLALSAREAIGLATVGGAQALGLEQEIGSLEPGKSADLVVFDGDSPALANVHDPFQAVVYCAGPREVKDVWIAGRRVVIDGNVTVVDPAVIVERSRPCARALALRAGLGALSGLALDEVASAAPRQAVLS